MKIEDSYILLKDLRFHAFHGVASQETRVGNTFIINLKMKVNFVEAAQTDDVALTVSYADVYSILAQEMRTPSKLLEHVVYRLAKALFRHFDQIEALEISLEKNNPPMGADINSAGVSLTCTRN